MGGAESRVIGSYRVTRIRQLAEGGFSFVDLVEDDQRSNVKYALKRILCQTPEQIAAAKEEIALHQAISHPFVLQLLASDIQEAKNTEIQGAQEALLLFPLYSHGSLVDAVTRWSTDSSPHTPYPFHESEALRIFYALCQGVQALHAAGYRHGDIKPHNVLLAFPYSNVPDSASTTAANSSSLLSNAASDPVLSSEPVPILIDLGSASPLLQTPQDRKDASLLQEHFAEHATASYRAPELWDVRVSSPIDDRADVFSLGATLYFMAFGTSAFENEVEGVLTLAIRQGNVKFPEEYVLSDDEQTARRQIFSSSASAVPSSRLFSSSFTTFLRSLLVADPAQRLTLKEVMKKCVVLMMAALAREKEQEKALQNGSNTASAAPSTPGGGDDDDFASFASANTSDVFSASPNASPTSPTKFSASSFSDSALAEILNQMTRGSSSSAASSSSSSSSSPTSSSTFAPGGFLKFGTRGSPHSTLLTLSPTHTSLTYTSKNGRVNTIDLKRVFTLVTGQVTSKFMRVKKDANSPYAQKAHLSFSLLLKPSSGKNGSNDKEEELDPASGEETLDLLAENHELYRVWTTGLHALINRRTKRK